MKCIFKYIFLVISALMSMARIGEMQAVPVQQSACDGLEEGSLCSYTATAPRSGGIMHHSGYCLGGVCLIK